MSTSIALAATALTFIVIGLVVKKILKEVEEELNSLEYGAYWFDSSKSRKKGRD